MKHFQYTNPVTFEDASKKLQSADVRAVPIAGGTDLINELKEQILPRTPELLVNLKNIKDGERIVEENDVVRIGALTRLNDIADSPVAREHIPAVTQAAHSVASPTIRNSATIGGNICQDVRCWYYRYPNEIGNMLNCARKEGTTCYAILGRNKYHSVFGGMPVCTTSCTMDCPAGTDIPGYMEQLRRGNKENAARIIMNANPMPSITARVCAHTCQNHCSRSLYDESVAIRTVERTLGDYIMENSHIFFAAPAVESGHSIAVIGSGPAGLTAAYYLRKAGNEVVIYEKMDEPGGMLSYAIPSYRLPKKYVQDLVKALEAMGVTFVTNCAIGEKVTVDELEKKHDRLLFATGAWKRPVLGFDGEEFTEFGLQFLIEVKQWIDKKKRNTVLVTGGGNVAMDVAITAKRMGAKNVILACLESEPEMPASKEEIARAREEGVVIMPSFGISRAIYEGEQVVGMELKRCVAVFDENKRFSPRYDESEKKMIEADSILMAVGQRVDLSFLDEKYELAIKRGLIAVTDEESQQTSRSGVYAAGDVTTGPSTVIMAIRGGRNSARHINASFGLNAIDKSQPSFMSYDRELAKQHLPAKQKELPPQERDLEKEDSFTLDWDEALKEAGRCLNCGCYSVNASDISPVLVALDAVIMTTEREIRALDFFTSQVDVKKNLQKGELVKEIVVPKCNGFSTGYLKMRFRNSIDFAVTSLAYCYKMQAGVMEDCRLVLGGVAPVPLRLFAVERFLSGKKVTPDIIDKAAAMACEGAVPMEENSFKLQEIKVQIRQSLTGLVQ